MNARVFLLMAWIGWPALATSTTTPATNWYASLEITAPATSVVGKPITATVTPLAGTTFLWTVIGGTIQGANTGLSVNITPTATGTLTLACTATLAGQSSTGTVTLQSQNATQASQPSGFYGSGLTEDALANTPLGKIFGFQVAYRILCNHTGALQDVRPYFIWSATEAGYAAGTGGTIRVQIQTDDGSASHNPSGTALATLTYADPVLDPAGNFPQLTFSSPAQLTAGNLYHVVFSNVDANPDSNWVSLDTGYIAYCDNPVQPTVSNTDLATLWRIGASGAWSVRESGPTEAYTPIIELDYADGASQGQGYMEFWIGAPELISGSRMVRETFTVSGSDRLVSSAAVHLTYVSGPGPLTISLENAEGSVLASGTVAKVPVSLDVSGGSWAQVSFATPQALAVGQTYNLVLSAPAGTVFTAFPMRKGSDKGFKPTTIFPDGHAEFNDGNGWVGWTQWGTPDLVDSDLQFYFQVVE